ncbi:MAG: DUF4190 domain-containing protein [Actinobacteria bacterium]|nr:DUF4190 domain-containing protein [Actinomycetota bacterium]
MTYTQHASPVPQQPAAPPLPAPTDGMAIAAFVCALCGLGLIPVVLGHVSLRRISRQGLRGQGFAIVALILGYLTIIASIIGLLLVRGGVLWAVNS